MAKSLSRMLGARRCAVILLAAALPASAATHASAQMDDAPATLAMGNGRMVRGTVTATAAGHLTVKTETGDVYDIAITPNTQLRKGRDQVRIADVHVGDGVGSMGEFDAPKKTVHALFVTVVDADQIKKAREAMGKTVISGTVTAIKELRLTIKRTDDVVQVIGVDEGTSFRRGTRTMMAAFAADATGGMGVPVPAAPAAAESLTLADVKVGSVVAGRGSVKNGMFIPTELAIADPSAAAPRQQRRRSDAAAPAGTAPPLASTPTTTPPIFWDGA